MGLYVMTNDRGLRKVLNGESQGANEDCITRVGGEHAEARFHDARPWHGWP